METPHNKPEEHGIQVIDYVHQELVVASKEDEVTDDVRETYWLLWVIWDILFVFIWIVKVDST